MEHCQMNPNTPTTYTLGRAEANLEAIALHGYVPGRICAMQSSA